MKVLGILTALVGLTSSASAQSLDTFQLANDLGSVLGSEAACGLQFDQSAISAFIETKVKADDMSFASTLQTMVMGHEHQLQQMSVSAKTAHCTQIARVAKSYNFIR